MKILNTLTQKTKIFLTDDEVYFVGGFLAGFFGRSDVRGCKTEFDLMSLKFTGISKRNNYNDGIVK